MSSIYADVALLIIWSWDTIASITDFIISGATFSPNPNRIRQNRWPLKMTVWNGHSVLSTWIWRYAFRKSKSYTLTPCRLHSLSFCAHTSALAVKASTKPFNSQAPDAPLILKVFVWRRRRPILRGLRGQSWQLSLGSIAVPHSSFPSWMRHVVDV